MRFFVMSLPKDGDKLARFRSDLARILPGVSCDIPEMFNARLFSEQEIAAVYNREKTLENYGREIGRGEIGNILSQQSIFETTVGDQRQSAVIFEDDAMLSSRMTQAMPFIQDWLSRHEDVPVALLLSQPSKYRVWFSEGLGDGQHRLVRVFSASGNYGYVVNAKGAQCLLEMNRPISRHPDDWLHYQKSGRIQLFAVHPFLVGNYDFDRKRSNLSVERYEMWKASSAADAKLSVGRRLRGITRHYATRLVDRLTGVTVIQERSNDGLEK